MSTRREFIRVSALTGIGLAAPFDLGVRRAYASFLVQQTPLPGKAIPKFVDPLPTFAGSRVTGSNLIVSVCESEQAVLPSSFRYPNPFSGTYVWGYRIFNGAVVRGPLYPGFTVEANRGVPMTVMYVNELPSKPKLQQYLTIDQTIHWANPLDIMMDDSGRREPYAGPPPIVTHLHGGEVPSEVDGGPDAWFTTVDADTGQALHGSAYYSLIPTSSNAAVYQYPNAQEASTLWFHDHALGATRTNVYAGLAAFYFLRDPDSLDTGIAAPGGLPAGDCEHEIAIQDRMFDTNGQWLFPDGYPSGPNGPPPNPEVHPFWIPEFFGDAIVVNGKTWPYLEVEPRRYRFRFLNGSNARFYSLRLMNRDADQPGPEFWVIGTDGGLLDYPVKLNDPAVSDPRRLFFAPGERFDVIIDFRNFAGQTLTLVNNAKAPYPSGTPAYPSTTGEIMQVRVIKPLTSADASYDPASGQPLRTPMVRLANPMVGTIAAGVAPDVHRQLTLVEIEGTGGPIEVLVNNTEWEGLNEDDRAPIPDSVPDGRGHFLTELPHIGATELWEIVNLTADAHPIHLHLVQFQLLNRQAFNAKNYQKLYDSSFEGGSFRATDGPPLPYGTVNGAGAIGGNPDVTPFLQGPIKPPGAEETGWKDTVKMFPGEVTRFVVRFAPQHLAAGATASGENYYPFDPTTGPGYVWHCHILDHEDNEMMRPYNLVDPKTA
jgi:spore coat protein A